MVSRRKKFVKKKFHNEKKKVLTNITTGIIMFTKRSKINLFILAAPDPTFKLRNRDQDEFGEKAEHPEQKIDSQIHMVPGVKHKREIDKDKDRDPYQIDESAGKRREAPFRHKRNEQKKQAAEKTGQNMEPEVPDRNRRQLSTAGIHRPPSQCIITYL
jgi:hypothetical protein